jgi:hypothetical protein
VAKVSLLADQDYDSDEHWDAGDYPYTPGPDETGDFPHTDPVSSPPSPRPGFADIFGAPDYTQLVKKAKTARAREYQQRTNSVLKAGLMASLNTGRYPDAAAILKLGPAFAAATGEFADSNDTARHIIDLVTAPDSAALIFAMTAIPLIAQLFRNNEPALSQVPVNMRQSRAKRKQAKKTPQAERPKPRFSVTIPFTHKTIGVRFRVHVPFGKIITGLKSQTVDPGHLASEVLSDPKVQEALKRMGWHAATSE